jgi:hypothetical protein
LVRRVLAEQGNSSAISEHQVGEDVMADEQFVIFRLGEHARPVVNLLHEVSRLEVLSRRDVAAGRFRVEGLTADEHGTVARLDEQYAALDLGLADLSVVILAHRFRTRRLLTFDERDFRAVAPLSGGSFTLLPRDNAGP